jgi:hypothetical protein
MDWCLMTVCSSAQRSKLVNQADARTRLCVAGHPHLQPDMRQLVLMNYDT